MPIAAGGCHARYQRHRGWTKSIAPGGSGSRAMGFAHPSRAIAYADLPPKGAIVDPPAAARSNYGSPPPRGKFLKYKLETYHRSNQDTCLLQKPAIKEGDWVQTGDLLADSASSIGGELAIGHNIIVAYMPWEGYNYEDAILINERLVYEDIYTSIHIERYEITTKDTKLGPEQITREIPDTNENEISHLDKNGIAKIGSWVEEGDILVGKITPFNVKTLTPQQKLLYKIFDKQLSTTKDSSLRAPKGIKANVININILAKQKIKANKSQKSDRKGRPVQNTGRSKPTKFQGELRSHSMPEGIQDVNKKQSVTGDPKKSSRKQKTSKKNKYTKIILRSMKGKAQKLRASTSTHKQQIVLANLTQQVITSLTTYKICSPLLRCRVNGTDCGRSPSLLLNGADKVRYGPYKKGKPIYRVKNLIVYNDNYVPYPSAAGERKIKGKGDQSKSTKVSLSTSRKQGTTPNRKGQSLAHGKGRAQRKKTHTKSKPSYVHIYLAEKRKMQVGDKMAGRHGNKGIVSRILPRQDMPFLPDGTSVDIVLNPLGVPSRMNVGQIFECLLGLAGRYLGEHYKIPPFDEIYGADASRSFVLSKLYEARKKTGLKWLFDPNNPGKIRLFDGRNSECFDQTVTVGIAYVLKLVHMVDDKLHMRSTGPYSLVTQQPLRGRSKQGGQRLGEMEVWAIEGYGAAFVLSEMLTIKSDDMTGRQNLWKNLIENNDISLGTPESFKVLVCELQALCLDIGLFRKNDVNKISAALELRSKTSSPSLVEIDNLLHLA
jgi:DNA-directed RNA polymerase subunit beta